MRYVPRAVMLGSINALAILIFLAQIPHLTDVPFAFYPVAALSLAIIYILPRFTNGIPSPLVAIAVMTAAAIALKLDIPTVGDMGELPSSLPIFALPQVPFNLETLRIIVPYPVTMAIVGLLASFLTASLVDEMTDTPSDKNREANGQGIANLVTGLFGGMAGCGMIGQTVINVKSGGRGRLSTFCAGIFLLFAILVLSPWVRQMPMATLAAVMIMVSIGTFRWSSFQAISRTPRNETVVMLATMTVTVITHNFALGVIVGIVMSTVFFSRRIANRVFVDKALSADGRHCTYSVVGQIFFLSVDEFLSAFDFGELVDSVTVDLTHAHIWDQEAVVAIDKMVFKFRRNGINVNLIGMNHASASLIDKLALHKQPEAVG